MTYNDLKERKKEDSPKQPNGNVCLLRNLYMTNTLSRDLNSLGFRLHMELIVYITNILWDFIIKSVNGKS